MNTDAILFYFFIHPAEDFFSVHISVCFDKPISLTSKNLSSDFRKTHTPVGPFTLRFLLSFYSPLIKLFFTLEVDFW